jgi:hypothetical protein
MVPSELPEGPLIQCSPGAALLDRSRFWRGGGGLGLGVVAVVRNVDHVVGKTMSYRELGARISGLFASRNRTQLVQFIG